MNRNEEKGRRFTVGVHRKGKTRKGQRVARSKPDTRLRPFTVNPVHGEPPVPPFAENAQGKPFVEAKKDSGVMNALRLFALERALKDALHFYDRAAGNVRGDHGYTAADVLRLEEIRKLVGM
jgi:hypothetical protein